MQCATHPDVETHLRCATCGRPICPDCLVQTPVGMKCREHGLAPLPPHYRVSPAGYGAALPVGLVLGAIGAALAARFPFLLWALLLGFAGGRGIGEAVSYTSGWKRGPLLALPAAVSVLVGSLLGGPYLLRLWLGFPPSSAADLLRLAALPSVWIFGGVAALTVYRRLR